MIRLGLVLAVLAQGQAATHATVRPVVELVVAAPGEEAALLGQVASELLDWLSVDVRLRRVRAIDVADIAHPSESGSAFLARAYVDLRRPGVDHSVLWLVDTAHDRVLIRDLETGPGQEELTREELGHILELSTEGLLVGEAIGVPRAEALPLLEPRAAAKPLPRRARHVEPWQAALFYEAAVMSGFSRLAQGPEAAIFAPIPVDNVHLGVWISGQYRLPENVTSTPVGARLEGGAVRALLTFDEHLSSAVKLRWGLGGGSDFVVLEPAERVANRVALAPSRLLSFGVARAAVGLEVRLAKRLSLWSRFAADFDFSGTTYVFERTATEEVVLRPWAVRPALALGVGFP